MKVLHDWLKEFAELTLPAEELRARLTLAGIAVEGLAQTAAGPLLDADLTINRPDCLGHYGMAREAAALERKRLRPVEVKLTEAAETPPKSTPGRQVHARRDRMPGFVRALYGASAARREDRAVARAAAAAPGGAGASFH